MRATAGGRCVRRRARSGEVYVALQQKTVDCILFLANLTLSSKVYEVAPYIRTGATAQNSSIYYLNMAQWNKFRRPTRSHLQVSDEVLAAGTMKMAEQQQDEALNELEKAGAKVYRATPQEISAMRKAMSPVYAELEKFSGAEG